jgi:S1-C subfamily serine protease
MRTLIITLFCFLLGSVAVAQERVKAWLGATVAGLSADDAGKLGMESPHGVKVTAIATGGPAEKAGDLCMWLPGQTS